MVDSLSITLFYPADCGGRQYLINHGGLVPFDGDGMREYLVDEYVRDSSDPPLVEGLRAGSLLEVPREEVSRKNKENRRAHTEETKRDLMP